MKTNNEIKIFYLLPVLALSLAACGNEDEDAEMPQVAKSSKTEKKEVKEKPASEKQTLTYTDEDLKNSQVVPVNFNTICDLDTDGERKLNWDLKFAKEDFMVYIPKEAKAGDLLNDQGDRFTSEAEVLENSAKRIHLKGRIVETVVNEAKSEILPGLKLVEGSVTRNYDYLWTLSDGEEHGSFVVKITSSGNVVDDQSRKTDWENIEGLLKWSWDSGENWDLSDDYKKNLVALAEMGFQSRTPEAQIQKLKVLNMSETPKLLSMVSGKGQVRHEGKTVDFAKQASIGLFDIYVVLSLLDDPS